MACTDGELIQQVRAGDEHAFGALCDRYASVMRGRIRRRLSTAVLRKVSASDILQESYLVAFQRLEEFEYQGTGSFGRWLARIVQHKAMHAARKFKGTVMRADVDEVSRDDRCETANVAGRGPSPSQAAIASELRDRVRDAVRQLSADHRQVLKLRQEEHLTLREAAVRMGRSHEATKKLYARAIARLADLLNLSRRHPHG